MDKSGPRRFEEIKSSPCNGTAKGIRVYPVPPIDVLLCVLRPPFLSSVCVCPRIIVKKCCNSIVHVQISQVIIAAFPRKDIFIRLLVIILLFHLSRAAISFALGGC